ncbi:MAG: hypothetical protein E7465_05545 [Ruminococcaceae bacterium]|nr:hypothetical protein [Oscillospiraceae bacterium]
MEEVRGFVTVATGSDHYYKMAADLLLSYRGRGKGEYPFALICDRENEYTALFDHVILVREFRGSTVDKLLMRHAPYQESLFLDADILILENIDDLWDVFRDADDVSVFGQVLPLDSQEGWFTYEGSGKYKPLVRYLLSMNGGIYYFRKTARAEKIFDDALGVMEDYASIDFKYFDTPQDEPLMAMSLVINGCMPCEKEYPMTILPACSHKVTADFSGKVYEDKRPSDAKFIHFSTPRTKLFLYNYLNEINHHPDGWRTRGNFLKTRARFAAADAKFSLYHNAGAVLRRCGMAAVVRGLKRILH